MLRIWNLGRALDLLASSLPSEFQAVSTDVSQASIQPIRVDESYSTTVTLPPVWATAQPQSSQKRRIPISIAAEIPSVSTVWAEETVYVTVTVDVMPTSSSTSEQSWTTETTPYIHVDDNHFMPTVIPGKRAREPDVGTFTVEELVYVTVTVDVPPKTGSTWQHSWMTATTSCSHEVVNGTMKSSTIGVDVPLTSSTTSQHSWTTATTPCSHEVVDGTMKFSAIGVDVPSTTSSTSQHSWMTATTPCSHEVVDGTMKSSTISVDVLPTTSTTSQHSWTTVTTPCAHEDDDRLIKPNLPGKRAVVVKELVGTEFVHVTVTDSSSVSLDLSSVISNYNPTSTYTIEESAVPATSSPSFVLPPLPLTSKSTMKPEDAPGYWLKGGIVSTRGQAVHRKHAESSSVTTDYTHDVHPTIQANEWLGRFRNFARKEAIKKGSTCGSTIPTLAAAPTCPTTTAEEQLDSKDSLTKSNKAREWLRLLVNRSDTPTAAKRDIHTSTIRSVSLANFPPWTEYRIIDDHDGTASPSTWTTSIFSRDSSSTESLGTTTRTSYSTSTRSVQVTASLQETTLTSWTRSTTIWPDSATSWSPSPTPTPTSLEWDWWKGTKWQKTIAGEKKVRSAAAAAAVEQKVEMSGWKRAENHVSPWVITFGVVLLALTLTVIYYASQRLGQIRYPR